MNSKVGQTQGHTCCFWDSKHKYIHAAFGIVNKYIHAAFGIVNQNKYIHAAFEVVNKIIIGIEETVYNCSIHDTCFKIRSIIVAVS